MEKPIAPPSDPEMLKQWRALRYGVKSNEYPAAEVRSLKRWLAVSLLIYAAFAAAVWQCFFSRSSTLEEQEHVSLAGAAFGLALIYFFAYVKTMIAAYRVQKQMHAIGLTRHAGWQVVVGSLILNPYVLLGLWVPASVLISAGRAERRFANPVENPARP